MDKGTREFAASMMLHFKKLENEAERAIDLLQLRRGSADVDYTTAPLHELFQFIGFPPEDGEVICYDFIAEGFYKLHTHASMVKYIARVEAQFEQYQREANA